MNYINNYLNSWRLGTKSISSDENSYADQTSTIPQRKPNSSNQTNSAAVVVSTTSRTNQSSNNVDPATRLVYLTDNAANSIFNKHQVLYSCPEKPARTPEAIKFFQEKGVMTAANTRYVQGNGATDEQLCLAHSASYILILTEAVSLAEKTKAVFNLGQVKNLSIKNIVQLANNRGIELTDKSRASPEDILERFSTIPNLEDICKLFNLVNGDVAISPGTMDAARFAAGAVIQAVDIVSDDQSVFSKAHCFIRPPGHHSGSDNGMGFCVINNIAVGAVYAVKKKGYKRVMVVDFDAHHGNGTQAIFSIANKANALIKKSPNYCIFNVHWDTQAQHDGWKTKGFYPANASAAADVTEVINGQRTVMNFPAISTNFKDRSDMRQVVMKAIKEDLVKEMDKFQPDFILVSCGVDGHIDDQYGMGLTNSDYKEIGETISLIAKKAGQVLGKTVPVVSVMEGGYNTKTIGEVTLEFTRGLGTDM